MSERDGHPSGSARTERPSNFRMPPQNLQAERGVLGGIMLDNEQMHEIIGFLKAGDFYRDTHQLIYHAMVELYSESKPIDPVTIADHLTKRELFHKIGGDKTLTEILDGLPHAANTLHFGQFVKQHGVTRQLIEVGNLILRDGYSGKFTAEQLLETAERAIFAVGDQNASKDPVKLGDVLGAAMDRIFTRADGGLVGLSSGFHSIDQMVGGLTDGQFVVIAGRPSMGKTALGLNIAERVALRQEQVLFLSLEMSEQSLTERMLAGIAKVDSHKIRTGQGMGTAERHKLEDAFRKLRLATLSIDDSVARSAVEASAVARRFKARNGLKLLVIDYLQLMEPSSESNSRANRQEQVSAMSRRFKALAKELQVPLLLLSQLNRENEKRSDKRPLMSDLRESGAIEQDADLVILLHRPDYYDPNDQPGTAEVNVAKHRNGPTGMVRLTFLRHLTRFEDYHVPSEIDPKNF